MSDEKAELYYALDQAAEGLRKRHGQSLFKLIEKITETDKDAEELRKLFYKLLPIFRKLDTLDALADHMEETGNRAERAAEQLPRKPRPPIGRIVRDPDTRFKKCPKCDSSLALKWIFFIKNGGCINPPCERYHGNDLSRS